MEVETLFEAFVTPDKNIDPHPIKKAAGNILPHKLPCSPERVVHPGKS
jgi:hypothetical protein